MANQFSRFGEDCGRIAAVRTRLFAADVQFCCSIQILGGAFVTFKGCDWFQWLRLALGFGVGA